MPLGTPYPVCPGPKGLHNGESAEIIKTICLPLPLSASLSFMEPLLFTLDDRVMRAQGQANTRQSQLLASADSQEAAGNTMVGGFIGMLSGKK